MEAHFVSLVLPPTDKTKELIKYNQSKAFLISLSVPFVSLV